MLTTLDLERRRRGICGSDIAKILGMSPYGGPFDVWLDKIGQSGETTQTEAMRWGHKHEPTIIAEFAERHPELGPVSLNNNKTWANMTDAWMLGTPDALFRDEWHGLEVKTASFNRGEWGESGTLKVPKHYYLQCLWYMAVMEWDTWHLAVLIGTNDYREYKFHRDIDVEAQLIERARAFWTDHVLADVAPEVDASPAVAEYIKRKFPTPTDEMLPATDEQTQLFEALEVARRVSDSATAAKDELENKLKFAIGGAAGIQFPTGKITWKRSRDGKNTDWQTVATEAGASAELIAAHTEVRPGSRRFLATFNG